MKNIYYYTPQTSGVVIKGKRYCDGMISEIKKNHPKVFKKLLDNGTIIKEVEQDGKNKSEENKEVVPEG
jgi:hypothetical protein